MFALVAAVAVSGADIWERHRHRVAHPHLHPEDRSRA